MRSVLLRLLILALFLIICVALVWPSAGLREGLEDTYAIFTLSDSAVHEESSGTDIFRKEGDIWKGAEHYGDLTVGPDGKISYGEETAQAVYYKRLDKYLTVDQPAIEFDRKSTSATSATIRHKGSQIGRLEGDQLSLLQHPSAIALLPFIVGAIVYYESLDV